MRMLALLLLLAVSAGAQLTPGSPEQASTATVWEQLQASAWGAPYPEWQREHPQLTCVQYPQGEHISLPDDLWSYRCSQGAQSVASESLFYALSLDDPLAARLQQFRAAISGFPLAQLDAIHHELSAR